MSGNPLYLSSALSKLENWSKQIPMKGNEATSHMYIVHPFRGSGIFNAVQYPPIYRRKNQETERNEIINCLDKVQPKIGESLLFLPLEPV